MKKSIMAYLKGGKRKQPALFAPFLQAPGRFAFQGMGVYNKVKLSEGGMAVSYTHLDKSVQQRFLRTLSFGGGCINDTVMHLASPALPFGGVGRLPWQGQL